MNKTSEKNSSIRSVEEFINQVKNIQDQNKGNSKIFVYRGEREDFGVTSCMPNIFREILYINNENFEKSLYEDMFSKGIVSKQSHLDTAIDAQHGGFPSRLLDVSYNALIALYFATEFKSEEKISGDSVVTVFNIEEVYIPGTKNSEELFEQLIHTNSSARNIDICAFNHKLIDHMNKNERIKAQQGAFILFQGTEYRAIPDVMYKKIRIDKDSIREINNDLDRLFGLNVGKIYPEVSTAV